MPRFALPSIKRRISSRTLARWGERIVLAVLGTLSIVLLINFVRMTWKEHQINQEIARQQAEVAAVEAERDRLRGEAEFRESDMFVEQYAREQGYAREGETVLLPTVVLPPTAVPSAPPAADAPPPEVAAAPVATTPNYVRWWYALFPGPDTQP